MFALQNALFSTKPDLVNIDFGLSMLCMTTYANRQYTAALLCLLAAASFSISASASDSTSTISNPKSHEDQKVTPKVKKFSWGPEIGVNLTNFVPMQNSYPCFNYALGLVADYRFTKKMTIQLTLRAPILSYGQEAGVVGSTPDYKERDQYSFSYVTLPIYLTYFPSGKCFFLFTGPQPGWLFSAYGSSENVYQNGHVQRMGGSLFDKSLFNPFNLAYDLGVGYRFHLRRVEPTLRLGFSQGLTEVRKDSDYLNYSQECFLMAGILF